MGEAACAIQMHSPVHVRLCDYLFLYEGLYLLEDLQRMNKPSRVLKARPTGRLLQF